MTQDVIEALERDAGEFARDWCCNSTEEELKEALIAFVNKHTIVPTVTDEKVREFGGTWKDTPLTAENASMVLAFIEGGDLSKDDCEQSAKYLRRYFDYMNTCNNALGDEIIALAAKQGMSEEELEGFIWDIVNASRQELPLDKQTDDEFYAYASHALVNRFMECYKGETK